MKYLAAAVSELLVSTVLLGGLLSRLAAAEGGLAPAATPSQRSPPRTVAEVVPPPVPEAENAAPLYLAAVAVLEAEEVWDTNLAELAAEVYRSVFSPSGRRSFLAWIEGMRVPQENNRHPSVGDAYDEFVAGWEVRQSPRLLP